MKPTIAVIGASPDRRKFSNKCVRAYALAGYDVVPVHPMATDVEGYPVVSQAKDLPTRRYDRVSVYLPPSVGAKVMAELAGKDIGEVWLNPGADADEVVEAAEAAGLKVICACSIVDVGYSPADFTEV